MNNVNPYYCLLFRFGPLVLSGAGVLILLRNLGVLSHPSLGWWFSGAWVVLIYIGLLLFAGANSPRESRAQTPGRTSWCECQRCKVKRFRYVCILLSVGILFLFAELPPLYFDFLEFNQIAVAMLSMAVLFLFASLHASTEGHIDLSGISEPSTQAPTSPQQDNSQGTL